TWVNWAGWRFQVTLNAYGIQVIWAIGWSMVALAGLIRLPRWEILAFGLVLVGFHNCFDGLEPESFGAFSPLWKVLHAGGPFEIFSGVHVSIGYPLIPWVGVMALGYSVGPWFLQ